LEPSNVAGVKRSSCDLRELVAIRASICFTT
jgi:hypothetical protein